MSPARAAGMLPISTVADPSAIIPGPPGTQPGSMHGPVVSVRRAAGMLPISTVASPLRIVSGSAGCADGVGTGAGGWIGAWQCGESCSTMSVIRAAGFDMRPSIAPAILANVAATERIERDDAGRVRRRYSVDDDGALDGELVQYDEQGHVEVQLPYRAGVLDGEARFFERGRLQLRMTYRNGVEEGERILYGEQNKPAMTVAVRAGVQHGTTSWFRADGSLMRTAEFVDGEMRGEPVDYDERGRAVKKTNRK